MKKNKFMLTLLLSAASFCVSTINSPVMAVLPANVDTLRDGRSNALILGLIDEYRQAASPAVRTAILNDMRALDQSLAQRNADFQERVRANRDRMNEIIAEAAADAQEPAVQEPVVQAAADDDHLEVVQAHAAADDDRLEVVQAHAAADDDHLEGVQDMFNNAEAQAQAAAEAAEAAQAAQVAAARRIQKKFHQVKRETEQEEAQAEAASAQVYGAINARQRFRNEPEIVLHEHNGTRREKARQRIAEAEAVIAQEEEVLRREREAESRSDLKALGVAKTEVGIMTKEEKKALIARQKRR